MSEEMLLRLKHVYKSFGLGKNKVQAVKNVNVTIHKGNIIAIVGESGSGKTTLAKMILGLTPLSRGEMIYKGAPVCLKHYKAQKAYWRDVQAIFQDPFSCFNMFYTVEKLFNRCLKFIDEASDTQEALQRKYEACKFVNLDYKEICNKHAYELSGGQMQRIMIARIFLLKPRLLIADEPTSMIDACSRTQILDVLMRMRDNLEMSIVFITHDLGLAYYISDFLCIMEKGEIIEYGPSRQVLENPRAPYTKKLLDDVPRFNEPWLEV